MHTYEIIIYWSDEDQLFLAEVPELPGCISHGKSQKEALSKSNEAVSLWIETVQKDGLPIPEPKGRRLVYA
jgi:predicted RNase H-like HicB family nuclease